MDEVEDSRFNYNFPPEIDGYKIAQGNKTVARRAMLFFLGVSTGVAVSRVIPILTYTVWKLDTYNMTCEDIFPFLLRPPFPTTSTLGCVGAINYINVVMVAYAYQIICCDVMYVACLICLKSHMSILKKGFETIRIRCLRELNLKLDSREHLNDSDIKELVDMMNFEMKKCTLHLQSIIKNIQVIEEIYNKIILMQVLTVVFMMVCCLYMMSTVSIFSTTFAAQIIYLVALATQVTLYCWFGNEITVAGSEIPTSIYQSDWLSATTGFKRSMMINMLRLNRDIHLTVGKFTPLTIATLVSIFRGSYSYFAVLKNVEN
nr:odorant receptor 49b-like [Onthophagus taurus]